MIYYNDNCRMITSKLKELVPDIRITTNLKQTLDSSDTVLFFNFKHNKLYDRLLSNGVNLFPYHDFVHFVRNRATQLKVIDTITKYPLKREYIESHTGRIFSRSDLPILKVGYSHQGDGKYKWPSQHNKTCYNDPVVFEEFVQNHRAIRVLIIESDIFVIEQINDHWIKNQYPIDEIVYHFNIESERTIADIPHIEDIIRDACTIKEFCKTPLIGVDYAVGDKIGLLEVNDMVGMPKSIAAIDALTKLFVKVINAFPNRIL